MHIIKSFLFLSFFVLLTGCTTMRSGYTPSSELESSTINVEKEDISYSLDMHVEIGSFVFEKEDIVSVIKEKLRKTGKYKNIYYKPFSKRTQKHIHFRYVATGVKPNEEFARGYLSGTILMTIPIFFDYYTDMSMFLIEDNKEIYSASTAEKTTKTLWLPLIVLSPFFNAYVTGNKVLDMQTNYLINEMTINEKTQEKAKPIALFNSEVH